MTAPTLADALRNARDIIADDRALNAPGGRHLTVTTDAQGNAVLVSWQDSEHRILETVWERGAAPAVRPSATAVAWHYPNGKPYTLTWAGDDEARMAEAATAFGLTRTPLVAAVQPSADKVDAERWRALRSGEHLQFSVLLALTDPPPVVSASDGWEEIEGDDLDAAIDEARARTGDPA